MKDEEVYPVDVFFGTIWQAQMLKNLLENEGIESYVEDEILGTLAPWVASAGGMGAVRLCVSNVDREKTMKIVALFIHNHNEIEPE